MQTEQDLFSGHAVTSAFAEALHCADSENFYVLADCGDNQINELAGTPQAIGSRPSRGAPR